jgi:hypothetical protein
LVDEKDYDSSFGNFNLLFFDLFTKSSPQHAYNSV